VTPSFESLRMSLPRDPPLSRPRPDARDPAMSAKGSATCGPSFAAPEATSSMLTAAATWISAGSWSSPTSGTSIRASSPHQAASRRALHARTRPRIGHPRGSGATDRGDRAGGLGHVLFTTGGTEAISGRTSCDGGVIRCPSASASDPPCRSVFQRTTRDHWPSRRRRGSLITLCWPRWPSGTSGGKSKD
jgi:hypothetical protein